MGLPACVGVVGCTAVGCTAGGAATVDADDPGCLCGGVNAHGGECRDPCGVTGGVRRIGASRLWPNLIIGLGDRLAEHWADLLLQSMGSERRFSSFRLSKSSRECTSSRSAPSSCFLNSRQRVSARTKLASMDKVAQSSWLPSVPPRLPSIPASAAVPSALPPVPPVPALFVLPTALLLPLAGPMLPTARILLSRHLACKATSFATAHACSARCSAASANRAAF
mmetsp:Transcript_66223/g.122248  ORF Transcript_66223/g.122248 Transcript_66223/m.122248 type:complete len:224 (+) Transcript_66223:802-1473(+)